MPADTKHLRLMHRQWQFRRRLPAKLARETGKSWLVIGLHTDSLAEAQRLRDKINIDLRDAERSIHTDEAKLLREYLWADDQEREAFEAAWGDYAERLWEQAERHGDEKGKQEAISFYKRITGQEVPLELNVEDWMRHAPVAETTAQARLSAIRRFGRFSRDAPVHMVDRRLAGRYVTHLLSEGLARKSVNSQVTHLSSYWRFLVRKGVAQENPWREQSVSGDVEQERVPWSKDEVEALVQRAPTALLRDAVAVLALMGLRSSELTALRVLDCTGGLCRVRTGKTKSARRQLPWHSQLADMVEARLQGKGSNDYFFEELQGNPKGLPKRFTRFRNAIFPDLKNTEGQAEKTMHSLRKFWITERIRAGCPPYLVSELAGHKLPGMSLGVYYGGATPEQARLRGEAVKL